MAADEIDRLIIEIDAFKAKIDRTLSALRFQFSLLQNERTTLIQHKQMEASVAATVATAAMQQTVTAALNRPQPQSAAPPATLQPAPKPEWVTQLESKLKVQSNELKDLRALAEAISIGVETALSTSTNN